MTEYIELQCHSSFSLLDGASTPEALVKRAVELGMTALALTDHNAVYGAVQFVQAAKQHGIRPVLGAELTLDDGDHLTLLVENEAGWANLCWLITQARHNAGKGSATLPPTLLDGHTQGLIALSGSRGIIPPAQTHMYRDLFGPENFWIELQHHLLPEDNRIIGQRVALAQSLGVGYVATNNVHYARRDQQPLQDVLTTIHNLTSLDEGYRALRPNDEYHLKSGDELAGLFAAYPQALANTLRIADRCTFDLGYGLQALPDFPTPAGMSAADMLWNLCEQGLLARYPHPAGRVWHQLDTELAVIERSGLPNYFLIVWDIVRFARENRILCQGRGSAANSLVAHLLGISPVNPLEHDLVFERFLSDERQLVPDIDIDFQADRREEVIQYIYGRYGPDHAAMACTFVTFRARSAIRDVGRSLAIPPAILDTIASGVDPWAKENHDLPLPGHAGRLLEKLTGEIAGLTRHLGIHNGGFILTGAPIYRYVPTEPATMPDRTVVQWDKDSLETIGLVKIDILGLRMLSAIAEALDILQHTTGQRPDLDRLTFDDPAVYAMIARADTVGCFQVESRAQAQMLPRFRPRCFADLIVAISLIRPGPILGDMVHPYLRRRLGQEPVTYFHPLLEKALAETLGVILFQEQVLKVARDLAGFTPGQGELLRRALGAKDASTAIAAFREAFLAGAGARGVPVATAELVFAKLQSFGGYSFPKSHAAAFAVLVYWSAWLKYYYPLPFYTALLNHQPMGFWSPAVVLNDAKRHAIPILPVDVQHSAATCSVDAKKLRIGLTYVKGIGDETAQRIVAARKHGAFISLQDFCQRTQLSRRSVENLILAGAFDGWHIERRQLLWQLGQVAWDNTLDLVFDDTPVDLPPLSHLEALDMEHRLLGLSVEQHPLAVYRPWLTERGILGSAALAHCPNGRTVSAAGLNVVHQAPPTAKGFHFITLEDEDGFVNVIVRPDVYQRYRGVLRGSALLLVEGQVQREGIVTNLLAQRAKAMV